MDSLIEHFKNGDFNKCKEFCKDKDLERIFINCCREGYKDIAEWLISIYDKIDIHAYNERAFRFACENGYKDIAEWLISLDGKINIHARNEDAFRSACWYGHKYIAKWLTIFYDKIPDSLITHKEFIEYYNQTRIHHWSPEKHYLVRTKYPSYAKTIEYLYILYKSGKLFKSLPMEIVFLIFNYLI